MLYLHILCPNFVILMFSPDLKVGVNSAKTKPWWLNGKIKLKLCRIYKTKGMKEAFVDAIFPSVRESLFLETIQQKVVLQLSLSCFHVWVNAYANLKSVYTK